MSAPQSPSPALQLSQVSRNFGSIEAVSGLSFQVDRGEICCLLGPNGAGKSTTIRMCEGFIRPSSGEIRVLGLDPATDPDAVRARIGIMLQGGGSYSSIRVSEMLQLAASYNTNPHDPAWLMETLGLSQVARTPYRRLSGGQQQRLSLALAIISRPELVFLDEPTAGMDAQSRLMVWELISALRRDGVAVVLTTHLMDEAQSLADRVLIIDHGSIVAQGTPEEMIARTSPGALSLSTAGAAMDAATIDELSARIGAQIDTQRPGEYRILAPAQPELIATIAQFLAERDILATQLSTGTANLEEVFLELTGRRLRP